MKILVTGGCGYIGHYAVMDLLDKGHEVIVVDDLSTGYIDALDKRAKFYKVDIRDERKISEIFKTNKIELVMDFAARLVVEDSNNNPSEYYDINVLGLKVILDTMVKNNVNNIIFSSTAAVYGLLDKGSDLLNEDDITNPSNPYGETKLAGEKMIQWYSKAYDLNFIIFRYFNVVGGNKPGAKIDEFTTILPRIINSINSGNILQIFGNNYNTIDGTCIRDYIHVYDLVSAHTLAASLNNEIESGIYNLSIGKGTSILQLIDATSEIVGKKVNYEFVDRRVGDPVVSASSNRKFVIATGWEPEYSTISSMVDEAYNSWK